MVLLLGPRIRKPEETSIQTPHQHPIVLTVWVMAWWNIWRKPAWEVYTARSMGCDQEGVNDPQGVTALGRRHCQIEAGNLPPAQSSACWLLPPFSEASADSLARTFAHIWVQLLGLLGLNRCLLKCGPHGEKGVDHVLGKECSKKPAGCNMHFTPNVCLSGRFQPYKAQRKHL
jgi:hypothetical protein